MIERDGQTVRLLRGPEWIRNAIVLCLLLGPVFVAAGVIVAVGSAGSRSISGAIIGGAIAALLIGLGGFIIYRGFTRRRILVTIEATPTELRLCRPDSVIERLDRAAVDHVIYQASGGSFGSMGTFVLTMYDPNHRPVATWDLAKHYIRWPRRDMDGFFAASGIPGRCNPPARST